MKTQAKKILLSTTAIIIAGVLMSPQVNAQSNSWDYDAVIAGNVAKDVSVAGVTDITVTGGNGFVEGNADIYAGDVVNVMGDSGATFAYRDNRANIQSSLEGDLNSNMQIVIIDKDGLFFGSNFNADVQGIVASSGDITSSDIMDLGSLTISDVGNGGDITLNGIITVADAGLAAFVAPNVQNNGIITAKLGRVQIGAADNVTVDLYGDGLVELALSGELSDALIENNNSISAEGGLVQMSALAAKATVDNVVNNNGVIRVSSATVVGGKIILSGGDSGTVRNSSNLLASNGGEIEISGERFLQENSFAYIDTNSGNININIETTGDVEIKGGYVNAGGGNINIDNGGIFNSDFANILQAEGSGTISVAQNAGGVIQNAIDAIDNAGTGANTVDVGAGTYNESVVADVENLILTGANAGVAGSGVRVAETIIDPSSPAIHVTADNVTVDGFTLTGATEGVLVTNADNARIRNNIVTSSSYGVVANNSNNAIVEYNSITDAIEGVVGDQAYELWVYDNDITDASLNGIRISNSSGTNYGNDVDVWKNRISGAAGSTGILVENSNNTTIGGYVNNQYGESDSTATGNVISGVDDGVVIRDSNNAFVIYNTIDNVAYRGVFASDANGTQILRNDINNSPYGINIRNSSDVSVRENFVDGSSYAVDADNAYKLWVYNNDITGASVNGIYVSNSGGNNYADDVDIWQNRISGAAGSTGILVENSNFVTIGSYMNNQFGGSDTLATGNVISGVDDAIIVNNSARTKVLYNTVNDVFGDAITVNYSNNADILDNVIDGANTGVLLTSSSDALIKGNDISNTEEGIGANQTPELWVYDNDITDASLNGIRVSNSAGTNNFNDVDIWKNRISGAAGSTGILIENSAFATVGAYINYQYGEFDSVATGNVISGVDDGVVIRNSDNAMVTFSTISDVSGNGVDVSNSSDARVRRNVIDGANNGIYASDVNNLSITGNDIDESYENGIYIAGGDNGYVNLAGNILTDNGLYSGSAAARFESGEIDLSELSNPNTIINTTALPAIGLQFDAMPTSSLTISGETLGGTIFDGFTPLGSSYVRFEDGSILDGLGNPIIIDGTDASFDGIIPASTGGILTAPDLNFIEERLYDADDAPVNGRGQIFVGAVAAPAAAPTVENIEDLFPASRSSGVEPRGASLTILGLPPTGAPDAAGLNNLAPAAGGDAGNAEELANLEPAAGGDAGNAGSQNVTCLNDVAGGVSGGSITYSFGGTFADSLSGASACSTSGI